jgi:hypothetical protein
VLLVLAGADHGLRAGRSTVRITVEATHFFLFYKNVQTNYWAQLASCSVGTGFFPGIQRPNPEINLSHSASVPGYERVETYVCSPICLYLYYCIYSYKLFYLKAVTNSENTASNTLKTAEQIGNSVEGRVVQIPPTISSGKTEENQVKRPIHSQLN